MNYLFIGGIPRSGTTMVQKILGNHPEISAGPEFDHIPKIMDLYSKMKYGLKTGRQEIYYNKDELKKIIENLISNIFQNRIHSQIKWVSEKTPSNALFFNELLELNSHYKCVFIVRDPRSIAASMREVYKKARRTGSQIKLTNSVSGYITIMDNYYKALKKVIKNNENRVLILYYEDIVNDTHEVIKELFKFIELNFTEDVLDITKTNDVNISSENITTAAWNNSRMKNNDEITKKNITNWKKVLSVRESNYIERYYLYRDNPFLKKYNFQKKNTLFDLWQRITYKICKP